LISGSVGAFQLMLTEVWMDEIFVQPCSASQVPNVFRNENKRLSGLLLRADIQTRMSDKPNKIFQFWQELKRRKVFRVIAMYAATAFIIMEAADIMFPRLGLPDWTVTILIIIILIGFPVTAVVSWIYDITPEGIFKTKPPETDNKDWQTVRPGRSIMSANNIVIVILFVAVCILLYPKLFKPAANEEIVSGSINTNTLIAVLPFSNSRPDPETDYLGFAMADQIIGELVYLNNITVRSSVSVRKYINQVVDPKKAGDDLKVDYILIGNYLKEANTIRLNIELVEVNSNALIWREPIEVDFSSTFELQDMVALKVVEGLDIQFMPKELDRIEQDIPVNPLAYEYYLRSISYPFTNEGDRMAIEMLNQSIELDTTYAPAYAQLADRMRRLVLYELHDQEELKVAENLFLKAISLSKDNMFALANLAALYAETSRAEKAVGVIQQLMEINPNNAEAHFSLGYIYRYAGMNSESVTEMEKAIAIDPENPGFRSIVISYQFAGELEKAFETSKRYEDSEFILGYQGAFLFRMGKEVESVEFIDRCLRMDPDGLQALWVTGLKAYIEGNTEVGLEAARQFEKVNIPDAEAWYHFAGNYALLGDRDGCIRALQRAVDGGFFNYPFMLSDSFLDSMREDKDFQKILLKAKEKHLDFRKRFF
jgi:TolB-like protein